MRAYNKHDIIREIEDFGTKDDKMVSKKTSKKDAQDYLMSAQLILSVVIIAVVMIMSKMLPNGFSALSDQYHSFVSKPPVWTLDSARNIFAPVVQAITGWFGNA